MRRHLGWEAKSGLFKQLELSVPLRDRSNFNFMPMMGAQQRPDTASKDGPCLFETVTSFLRLSGVVRRYGSAGVWKLSKEDNVDPFGRGLSKLNRKY